MDAFINGVAVPRIASAVPENVSLLEKQGIPNKVGILVYLGIGRLVSTVYRTKKVAMPNKETGTLAKMIT